MTVADTKSRVEAAAEQLVSDLRGGVLGNVAEVVPEILHVNATPKRAQMAAAQIAEGDQDVALSVVNALWPQEWPESEGDGAWWRTDLGIALRGRSRRSRLSAREGDLCRSGRHPRRRYRHGRVARPPRRDPIEQRNKAGGPLGSARTFGLMTNQHGVDVEEWLAKCGRMAKEHLVGQHGTGYGSDPVLVFERDGAPLMVVGVAPQGRPASQATFSLMLHCGPPLQTDAIGIVFEGLTHKDGASAPAHDAQVLIQEYEDLGPLSNVDQAVICWRVFPDGRARTRAMPYGYDDDGSVAWRDDAGWSDSEGGEIQEAVLERAFRPPGAAPRIDLFGDSSQTDIDGAVADYILRAGHNVVPFDFVP